MEKWSGTLRCTPRCSQPSTDVVRGELGLGPGDYGVVARLLVSPAARRRGIGRRLLDAARSEAASRQLVPVLEVVTRHEPAISLYEAFGWRRIGQAAIRIPDRSPIDVFVYVYDGSVTGPAPEPRRPRNPAGRPLSAAAARELERAPAAALRRVGGPVQPG